MPLIPKVFSQRVLSKKITLNIHELNFRKGLKMIEDQAAIKFAYSSDDFKIKNQSLNIQDQQLSTVLNYVLNRQLVCYKVWGKWVILFKIHEPQNITNRLT